MENGEGVKGVFEAQGQLQIIFGTGIVNKVFDAFVKEGGITAGSKEDVKAAAAQKGNWFQRFIKTLGDIFVPIIPAIVASGFLMGIMDALNFMNNNGFAHIDTGSSIYLFATLFANTAYTFLPILLCPDQPYDIHGVYSGSAYIEDGKMYLYYTGNVKHEGDHDYIRTGRGHNTCLAISENGETMASKQCLMENKDYPAGLTCHVRDPKVWKMDGKYYMVQGARTLEDRGEVLIFQSEDKIHWTHCNTITTPEIFGYMWECPDLFEIDGQWFLCVSPQGVAGRTTRVAHCAAPMSLRILADTSSVEVFVDGGATCMSTRCYPTSWGGTLDERHRRCTALGHETAIILSLFPLESPQASLVACGFSCICIVIRRRLTFIFYGCRIKPT